MQRSAVTRDADDAIAYATSVMGAMKHDDDGDRVLGLQSSRRIVGESAARKGDRDGDQDMDATDKGTPGSTCTGTVSGACRILDLDFDGDYDSTDATKFDALDQGLARPHSR